MFVSNIHGKQEVNALAASLGLKAGESVIGSGYGVPALGGNTFQIKDALKSAGAKWIGADKVWGFSSWSHLEKALAQLSK